MAAPPHATRPVILVVDDDPDMRKLLGAILSRSCEVIDAASTTQAMEALDGAGGVDAVLLDLRMPGEGGLEFLARARDTLHGLPVIVVTQSARVADAVHALKLGAFDYVTKPVVPEELLLTVSHAAERREMTRELYARRALDWQGARTEGDAVFASDAMRVILDTLRQVADSRVPVMLLGESGTGKEVLARTLHRCGRRRRGAFVAVNCAALPHDLVESELFGFEKGAFTGAMARTTGRFEEAKGGTLLLDEIGDLELGVQAKLLRVLQERELRRVGGGIVDVADVRVVVATNRDLAQEVRSQRFREDLLYRLDVITISVPPLRERLEEIPTLARCLLQRFAHDEGMPQRQLSDDAVALLARHSWPGNVRELENVLKRSALLSASELIGPGDIRWESALGPAPVLSAAAPAAPRAATMAEDDEGAAPAAAEDPVRKLKELEPELMLRALAETHGNVSEAARRLGIGRATFYRKASRYGIEV